MNRLKDFSLAVVKYASWAYVLLLNIYIFIWGFTSFSDGMAAAFAYQTAGGYDLDNESMALYATGVVDSWFS